MIDPTDFARYVFTIVLSVSGLAFVGVIVRRIALAGGRGRLREAGGATDPGQADAVRALTAEVDALRDEVGGLRRELDEAHNRLDFTERLLAQAKERGQLGAPKEPSR